MRRYLLALLLLTTPALATPPNIMVVLTDDQTYAQLRFTPTLQALAGAHVFDHFYSEVALCAPSRATFLTGQYAHNHGVLTVQPSNGGESAFRDDESSTIAMTLKAHGYATALFGKYMNGYGDVTAATYIPPGWTVWNGMPTESVYRGYGYTINDNGNLVQPAGWVGDELATRAIAFLRNATGPFFAYVAFPTPHRPSVPPTRYAGLYAGLQAPRHPNFNEADVSDKPSFLRFPLLTSSQIAGIDSYYRKEAQSLAGVDDAVARIIGALKSTGKWSNTVFIFWSDNGLHDGEHRDGGPGWYGGGKQLEYEEDSHLPLIFHGPGVVAGHDTRLTVNADLAPTILEFAGLDGSAMDGTSLVPLLHGQSPAWRHSIPLAHTTYPWQPPIPSYLGVRTGAWTYVRWADGQRELYNHAADPYELRDVSASQGGVVTALDALAVRLHSCGGAGCRSIEHEAVN